MAFRTITKFFWEKGSICSNFLEGTALIYKREEVNMSRSSCVSFTVSQGVTWLITVGYILTGCFLAAFSHCEIVPYGVFWWPVLPTLVCEHYTVGCGRVHRAHVCVWTSHMGEDDRVAMYQQNSSSTCKCLRGIYWDMEIYISPIFSQIFIPQSLILMSLNWGFQKRDR